MNNWSKFPFNPARWPFFYGYFVIVLGSIGAIMSCPGQTIGVAVFRNYLEMDLGLSKTGFGTAYTIGTLISGFMAVYSGRLYDKYGSRVMATIAAVLMGLALIYLSYTPEIFNALNIMHDDVYAIVLKIVFLIVGIFALRFFGQGMLILVSKNMVMKWFEEKRGMANVYLGLFLVLGLNSSPRLFQHIVDAFDWQTAWRIIAIFAALGFGLLAITFFRDNPKDVGLEPDNIKKSKHDNKISEEKVEKKNYTLPEALQTYTFWVFNLMLTMHAFFATGAAMYIKEIFWDAGYDEVKAVSVFIPSAIVAIVFQSIGSWLSDRTKLKYFLMIMACGLMLSMAGIYWLHAGDFMYYLLVLGMGMATGNFGIISTVSWPRFFGTRHLGAISGYNMKWVVIGSALPTVIFGSLYDLMGHFHVILIICFVITFVLALLAVKANNINR
ncbi:MAG: MFS transporter [Bacteroidetes bacterium]|nr:MFS transporter [Bacteroidota bacterium]